MTYKILVVDDSLPMRGVIKKTIKASGFSVEEYNDAADGVEALKILQEKPIDIVITDYNMPNMNGMELIEKMKADDRFSTIPVVVVTTEGSSNKVDEFILKGAAGYIKKPFTPEAIIAKLQEILGEVCDEGFDEDDDNLDF